MAGILSDIEQFQPGSLEGLLGFLKAAYGNAPAQQEAPYNSPREMAGNLLPSFAPQAPAAPPMGAGMGAGDALSAATSPPGGGQPGMGQAPPQALPPSSPAPLPQSSPVDGLRQGWNSLITAFREGQDPIAYAKLNQANQALQAKYTAYRGALIQNGVSPAQAHSYALAAATSPEAEKQISTMIGPRQAPTPVVIERPDGTKVTLLHDPRSGMLLSPDQLGLPNAPQGVGTSPFQPATPPPGADIAQYRKSAAETSVAEQKLLAEKAEGSIEFLQNAIPVHQKLSSGYYNNVIGPYQGLVNDYIRSPGNAVGVPTDLGKANEFKGENTKLSTSNLKAQFGARPTQYEFQQNQATFGAAGSADAATATKLLGTRIQESYSNLNRSLSLGQTKPEAVPPKVAEYGVSHGLLDPKLFPNVKAAPAAAQPNLPPGVSSIRVVQ